MKKSDATELLGGTPTAAADAINITYQAYSQWPEVLPPRLSDRVQAAIARRLLPAGVIGGATVEQTEPSDNSDESAISTNPAEAQQELVPISETEIPKRELDLIHLAQRDRNGGVRDLTIDTRKLRE